MTRNGVSVVMPTFHRPDEVADALVALAHQSHSVSEYVIVDGAPAGDVQTEHVVNELASRLALDVTYLRHSGGAAMQRNAGIERARGRFVFFVDDDIRPEPSCLQALFEVLDRDAERAIACAAGRHVASRTRALSSTRWRLYRAIGAMTTTRPGAYDWGSGHALPRLPADDIEGAVDVDVVGGGCALWRADVFEAGLRFDPFFDRYFFNEDVHLALNVRARGWRICDVPRAGFRHTSAAGGRPSDYIAARHGAINRRFVFADLVAPRARHQELRFWLVEALEVLARLVLVAARRMPIGAVRGHLAGVVAGWRTWPGRSATPTAGQRSSQL